MAKAESRDVEPILHFTISRITVFQQDLMVELLLAMTLSHYHDGVLHECDAEWDNRMPLYDSPFTGAAVLLRPRFDEQFFILLFQTPVQ